MSFSIAAVLLLVLAGASVIVIGQAEALQRNMDARNARLDAMHIESNRFSTQVDQSAYRLANQVCQEIKAKNESEIDESFQQAWSQFLCINYPRESSGFQVYVNKSEIHLRFLRLAMEESSQLNDLQQPGEIDWASSAIPVFFTMHGNFTIVVRNGQEFILREYGIEHTIQLPLPFLSNRLESFESDFAGGKNEFENVVRYELSALVQDRVLRGYGLADRNGPTSTKAILTEVDVKNAINLALILEQLKAFRTYDRNTANTLMLGMNGIENFEAVIGSIKGTEFLDPSDLFLRLCSPGSYDVGTILAESIYASADVFVLKWLDYLHVIDIMDYLESKSEEVQISLLWVLDSIMGKDSLREGMIRWMSERLKDDAGELEQHYRWLGLGLPDCSIYIPTRSVYMIDCDGQEYQITFGGHEPVDFPIYDLFQAEEWKQFLIDYKQSTFELAEALQNFVKAVACGIAAESQFPSIQPMLNPFDRQSYLNELKTGLTMSFNSNENWFEDATTHAQQVIKIRDSMGIALSAFIREHWMEIFDANNSVDFAIESLARHLVSESVSVLKGFSPLQIELETKRIIDMIRNDGSWGVGQAIWSGFKGFVDWRVDLFSRVFENATVDGSRTGFEELVIDLAGGAIDDIPGIEPAIELFSERMTADMVQYGRLRSDLITIPVHEDGDFNLMAENDVMIMEKIESRCTFPWLSGGSGLDIFVRHPSDYPTEVGKNPNRHITDIKNLTLAPFQTQFEVSVQGGFNVALKAIDQIASLMGTDKASSMGMDIQFDFNITLSTLSGWPLAGVEYSPTHTLVKDIESSFQMIWDGVVGALECVADGMSKAFSFLQDLLSTVLTYSMKLVQTISDLLMDLVQNLRGLIEGALSSFFEWLSDWLIEKIGKFSFNTTIAGINFKFDTGIPDISYGRSKELLRVTMAFILAGAKVEIGVRFVQLYKQGADLIINADLSGEGWRAQCQLDPLMLLMNHFLEIRGFFENWVLELNMPEVVSFEKKSFRLSDIPGLSMVLSRIPIPIPGLMASLDAGFEIKYDNPISDHVVINEVELNPHGSDNDNEWVEVYNPCRTTVDISGWYLETVHGSQSIAGLEAKAIPPKSRIVCRFQGQVLDNGGEIGIPLGESVILRDANGKKIDSTPFMTDYYNDAKTWQRIFDGVDRWVFKEQTKGAMNGLAVVDKNALEQLGQMLLDNAGRIFAEMEQLNFDIDALGELIQRTIMETVNLVIEILAQTLVEMSLFVEVALQDYSQSFNGGLRLALVVKGEFVRDALIWIADAVSNALSSLTSPTKVVGRAHNINELLDDIYIRFGTYGSIGLPKLVSSSIGGGSYKFGGQIDVNLASFIATNHGLKNGTMCLGVLFHELPGQLLSTAFCIDTDDLVDFWILKATIRASRPDESPPI